MEHLRLQVYLFPEILVLMSDHLYDPDDLIQAVILFPQHLLVHLEYLPVVLALQGRPHRVRFLIHTCREEACLVLGVKSENCLRLSYGLG